MGDASVRFVLISPPRTGSTMLAEMLDSHPDIACFGEVLNPKKQLWHPQEAPATPPMADPVGDPAAFLDEAVWPAAPGARAVGVKLLEIQIAGAYTVYQSYFSGFDDLRIVRIDRANPVERYVSIATAFQTGVWRREAEETPVPEPPPFEVDILDLERFFMVNHLHKAAVERAFAGRPFLSVVYEDVMTDPGTAGARLSRFLGVAPHPMQASSVRLPMRALSSRIANFDAVLAHFRDTVHAPLFEGADGDQSRGP